MKEPDVIRNSLRRLTFFSRVLFMTREHCRASWSNVSSKKCYHKKNRFSNNDPVIICSVVACDTREREISSTPCCPLFNSRVGCLHISVCRWLPGGCWLEQLHPGFLNSPISFCVCVCVHCVCVVIVSGCESPFHVRWRHNPATNQLLLWCTDADR
jgi:hypothetical protein